MQRRSARAPSGLWSQGSVPPPPGVSTNSTAGGRDPFQFRAWHCGDSKSETLGSERGDDQSHYQLQHSPGDRR